MSAPSNPCSRMVHNSYRPCENWAEVDTRPRITLDVTNAGRVAGQAVPQVCVSLPDGISAAPFRLVGLAKLFGPRMRWCGLRVHNTL
jgi:hypothetical protein